MSEEFVLSIICASGHKQRTIAKIYHDLRFESSKGEYIDDIKVIFSDKNHGLGMETFRLYRSAPTDTKADTRLLNSPHRTYTFSCRSRSCRDVPLEHENIRKIYEGFRHARKSECNLNALSANLSGL